MGRSGPVAYPGLTQRVHPAEPVLQVLGRGVLIERGLRAAQRVEALFDDREGAAGGGRGGEVDGHGCGGSRSRSGRAMGR